MNINIRLRYPDDGYFSKEYLELKRVYLDKEIFYGLKNLNTGFDVLTIRYFSAEEFTKVLERIEKKRFGIYGIEPWYNGHYYSVKTCPLDDDGLVNPAWYWSAFHEFEKDRKGLQYAASYYIPVEVLDEYFRRDSKNGGYFG